MLKAEVDSAQLSRVQSMLSEVKNGAPRALTRSLNATAKQGKTRAVRLGSQEINIKQAKLRAEIHGPLDKPYNKATFTYLTARITARLRGLRMMNFVTGYTDATAPTGTPPKPPRTKVSKRGGIRQWRGGFFIPLKNTGGLMGLFTRSGDRIEHRYGPSPSQIFNNIRERPEYSEGLSEYLAKELDRQVDVILEKAK